MESDTPHHTDPNRDINRSWGAQPQRHMCITTLAPTAQGTSRKMVFYSNRRVTNTALSILLDARRKSPINDSCTLQSCSLHEPANISTFKWEQLTRMSLNQKPLLQVHSLTEFSHLCGETQYTEFLPESQCSAYISWSAFFSLTYVAMWSLCCW